MTPLPIDSAIAQIINDVRGSRAVVIVAPPGAGKTTRVPPAILRAGLLSKTHPNLVLLQPRRVAARAVAQRMADENNWQLGQEIGYHIRFDRKIGPATRLRVMTEGILTRQLVDDPLLPGVGAVILDEFHERSIHTDLAIAMLREIRASVRPDLILIVMSATLEAEPVAKFLDDCPIMRSEGRLFPVEIVHRPGTYKELAQSVESALDDSDGDVLVFLPGAEEIRRCMRQLQPLAQRENWLLFPLHGSLGADEQTAALRPSDRRKIILATNIAETSLTIEGVRTVIDSGLARIAGYDPRRGMDRLELSRISRASATQRMGRAGRTASGRCIRLYSPAQERAMRDFDVPEIKRIDLSGTLLALHAFGQSDPRAFGWYEAPDAQTLESAERLLAMLGALSSETAGRITPIGEQLRSLPVHPRLGRLLIAAAKHGAIAEGATIAALLSEKDILRGESVPYHERHAKHKSDSDLIVRLELLKRIEAARFGPHLRDEGIDLSASRQVARVRDELIRLSRRLRSGSPSPLLVLRERDRVRADDLFLRFPLYAYPDRVCRRRGDSPAATMVGGGGVRLAPESSVHDAEFFLALDARQDERNPTREAIVRIASKIDVQWLLDGFPNSIERQRQVRYDADRKRIIAKNVLLYRGLPLREDDVAITPAQAGELLGEALRPLATQIFQSDEASVNLLNRVALLRQHMPEHPWPRFDDEQLADALAQAAIGKRSLDEITAAGLSNYVRQQLVYPLDRLLDQHAPESLTVPSGSRIHLAYDASGKPPVLAVRLQELFGWTETPRIAGERVPVLIHLLAPNFRPVQITADLKSFWTTTYFQVRKDLRVRYPKHAWPEDPLTAKAEAKGRRRA